MINYKHLESVSLSPVESPLQAAGFNARLSVWQPRHCAGSGLARKYKDGLEAHYWRWSRHPDESRDTLTATGFHERYPETVFRDRVRKLGMVFVWPTQHFGWPPCVFVFYYRLIIKLFPYHGLICTHFTFILPTLYISPFSAFGPWQ